MIIYLFLPERQAHALHRAQHAAALHINISCLFPALLVMFALPMFVCMSGSGVLVFMRMRRFATRMRMRVFGIVMRMLVRVRCLIMRMRVIVFFCHHVHAPFQSLIKTDIRCRPRYPRGSISERDFRQSRSHRP